MIPSSVKLPFRFDPGKLKEDAGRIGEAEWDAPLQPGNLRGRMERRGSALGHWNKNSQSSYMPIRTRPSLRTQRFSPAVHTFKKFLLLSIAR